MTAPRGAAAIDGTGRLFLVVGASGAGKDTLIDAARRQLGGDGDYAFPRRVISRPPHAGSEDFESITPEAFERRRREDAFALHWQSHGLSYGIPATIDGLIDTGKRVVVNVSRSVIGIARERYATTRVIEVVVPAAVAMARLHDRGRETPEDIAGRLERAAALTVDGPDVTTIDNSGALEPAVTRFVSALRDA
jgi:ribose 1,5-bisphosphokinase